MTTHGLGRIPSVPHPRMAEFPVEALLTPTMYPRSYTWSCDLWLDQGQTSECVPHSWTHEAAAAPVVRRDVTQDTAHKMYPYAQQHDQWPGENYDGTSLDGGAQAARQFGLIESWWWARNLEAALTALGHAGPGTFACDWWTGMFTPDARGFIYATGAKEGGHAILARQVRLVFKMGTSVAQRRASGWSLLLDRAASYVGLHNSWGEDWQPRRAGEPIPVKVNIDTFAQLLTDGGEFCVPVGRKRATT